MPLRFQLKFLGSHAQFLRRTADVISSELVSSQRAPQIQTCAHLPQRNHLQNYPFPQNNYRPDVSTAIYFQSPEQPVRWQHLDLPSFGIDAGHGIRSRAQPDYSIAPWTSRADFHTPQQSFLSQHYSAPPRTAQTKVWSQFQRSMTPEEGNPSGQWAMQTMGNAGASSTTGLSAANSCRLLCLQPVICRQPPAAAAAAAVLASSRAQYPSGRRTLQ